MMKCCRRGLCKLCVSVGCNICSIVPTIDVYIDHTVRHGGNSGVIMVSKGISATSNICKCLNVINIDNSVTAKINTDTTSISTMCASIRRDMPLLRALPLH